MKKTGYVENIEALTQANDYFRKVLYTDERLQLVVMSLLRRDRYGGSRSRSVYSSRAG
jgi:hypothetical protein